MGRVMDPLYFVVSSIMVAFHEFLTWAGLRSDAGITWTLSIVGLVVVIRILLIPLFVKQIKAQRALQIIQPEVKKLQEKYKHDKERQSRELMQLYKDRKANPFASCIPILAQAPIFFALFWLLDYIRVEEPKGVFTRELVREARAARLFGVELFGTLLQGGLAALLLGGTLVVLMTASTFWQQRQLIMKNMPPSALEGPFAKQQKFLMYLMPAVFLVTGLWFPIGVLIYWCTTNLWSLGQQMYVIERMPAPGSPAEAAMLRKKAQKGQGVPPSTPTEADNVSPDNAPGQAGAVSDRDSDGDVRRQQRRRKPRSKRR